jgi:hypothetical protein
VSVVRGIVAGDASKEREMNDEGKYVHLMTTAFLGKTAEHLRDVHGDNVHVGGDVRANAAAHMEAHDIPADARWRWRGRRFQITGGQFVRPWV